MTTQPFLSSLLFTTELFKMEQIYIFFCYMALPILDFWIFNVINSSNMNNLTTIQEFQERRKYWRTTRCFSRFHDYWDQFIWDHSFETTFISDHIHLRPHSFETTFIWDHIHLRHIHLRPLHLRPLHLGPHSFETTFVWDYIHLRSHSFYGMLKWSCFDLLCVTFCDLPFTFLQETWSFARWLFIWVFARLRPSVSRGGSRWAVNAPALKNTQEARKLFIPGIWKGALHLYKVI